MPISNHWAFRRTTEALPEQFKSNARAPQTGKTTLAIDWAERHKARYETLDDAVALETAAADPQGLIHGLALPAVIDEVQKIPARLPAIRLQVVRENGYEPKCEWMLRFTQRVFPNLLYHMQSVLCLFRHVFHVFVCKQFMMAKTDYPATYRRSPPIIEALCDDTV